MRFKFLHIFTFLSTLLLGFTAGAQTTYYVLSNTGDSEVTVMDRWSVNKNVTYKLSGPGKTLSVDHYKIWSAVSDITVYGYESDNGSGTATELQKLSSDTGWKTTIIDISSYPKIRSIKFSGGGTERKYIRNVSVSRATTLSSSTSSLSGFRTTPNTTVSKTITVDYNNTYSGAVLTGTCDNNNFSVQEESMGETGSKAITIKYNPTSVGTHNGKVTLTMGTAEKNNTATYSFDVSGTCYLTYTFSATANTGNAEFGSASVTLNNITKQNGQENSCTKESSNTQESFDAVFNAVPSTGYRFVGWYTDESFTDKIEGAGAEYRQTLTSTTANANSSRALYAKFEVDKTDATNQIQTFESTYASKTNDPQAAIDLANAKSALASATTVAEVNAALANLKAFDDITFDESIDNKIEKGGTLPTTGLATSLNGFTITYSSDDPSIIEVSGGNLVANGTGSALITATTHGDGHYSATASRTFTGYTAGKSDATITINVPSTLTIDDEITDVFTLSNTTIAPSVSFSREGVLEYVDGTLNAIGAGVVTIYVEQEENETWNLAHAEKEITVKKHTNAVSWKESPVTSLMALHTIDLTGYASATSGSISYSSSKTEVITIEGNVLTAHKAGSATITASVAASDKYSAANNTLEFTVNFVPTEIKWNQTLPALNDRGGNSVTLTASVIDHEGNTIPDAIIVYSSSAPTVASVSGNCLTPKSGGSAIITASYAGNEIYAASADVTKGISVTGYSVPSVWVNDWASAPSAVSQFYIYNTTNDKFLQEGHGEESRSAFVEAGVATLWVYANSQRIESTVNSNNYIANRTNQASTNGTGSISTYNFDYNNGKFRIRNGSGITTYDVFNNGGIFDGYNNGDGHFEWWVITPDQYDFRITNAPNAVNNYLYASEYASVVGPIRTSLADVCANTTSDFAAANAQIASLEQAFDDYLEALAAINTFEQEYASKTPDTTTPVSDIAAARAALREAANSDDIENALKKLRAFDKIIIERQPVAIIANGGGDVVSGIQASANSTISYASDDTGVLTISEDGKTITPSAVGHTTITLTTATSQTHYAAMPIQTSEVSVKDAFVLDPTSTEGYTTGEQSKVILKRTLLDGYSTIALPFDTTVEAITGNSEDKAYTLCNVGYKQGEGYTFYFKEVEGGELQAGNPYVISVASEVVNPQWEETTIGELNPGTVTCGAWSFIANFEAGKSMKDLYGVVNSQNPNKVNKVMKGGTNASLGAFTAYFCLADQDGGSTKAAGSAVAPSAAGSAAAADLPANAIPLFTVKE